MLSEIGVNKDVLVFLNKMICNLKENCVSILSNLMLSGVI